MSFKSKLGEFIEYSQTNNLDRDFTYNGYYKIHNWLFMFWMNIILPQTSIFKCQSGNIGVTIESPTEQDSKISETNEKNNTYIINYLKTAPGDIIYMLMISPVMNIDKGQGQHATLLMYNKIKNTLEHFDPNGKTPYIMPNTTITWNETVKLFANDIGKSLNATFCDKVGNKYLNVNHGGYCLLWCYFMIFMSASYPTYHPSYFMAALSKYPHFTRNRVIRGFYYKMMSDLRAQLPPDIIHKIHICPQKGDRFPLVVSSDEKHACEAYKAVSVYVPPTCG
jgi:hypothetical protein